MGDAADLAMPHRAESWWWKRAQGKQSRGCWTSRVRRQMHRMLDEFANPESNHLHAIGSKSDTVQRNLAPLDCKAE